MEALQAHPLYRRTIMCMTVGHVSTYLGYNDEDNRTVRNLIKAGELSVIDIKDARPVGHHGRQMYITIESINGYLRRTKQEYKTIKVEPYVS